MNDEASDVKLCMPSALIHSDGLVNSILVTHFPSDILQKSSWSFRHSGEFFEGERRNAEPKSNKHGCPL